MLAQVEFKAALLDADLPVPSGLLQPSGSAASTRFDVYRNNVMTSLIDAMVVGFPVVAAMLGDEYFRALAALYVRQNPPETPIMALYGQGFERFVADFEPLNNYPYLADTAKLELARRRALHAADQPCRGAESLAQFDSEELMQAIPVPHPSLHCIASPWPIHSLWRSHMGLEAKLESLQHQPQRLQLIRPQMQLHQSLLSSEQFAFDSQIDGRQSLADIAAGVLEQYPDTDISQMMVQAIQSGAIAEFKNSLEQCA